MSERGAPRERQDDIAFFGAVTAGLSHELKNVLATINELSGLQDDLQLLARRGRPLDDRLPARRLLLYIREIVASTDCPPILKACIVNTCLEHNHLSDTSRLPAFRENSFVSFTGLFIDLFDEPTRTYRNLFQPVALTIKPPGTVRERILTHEELRTRLEAVTGLRPKVVLGLALGQADRDRLTSLFTFQPGYFQE